MTDTHDLIVRSRGGDTLAFRDLVEHYETYAYTLAARLLADPDDASEVIQDAFVRVWRHLDRYDPRSRFTTWLYRIVTNLCYDRLRAHRRHRRLFAAGEVADLAAARHPSGDEGVLERIRHLSGELPPGQRTVFVLRDLQDLSTREVSQITGMAIGTVKTQLFHARRKIRERMEHERRGDETP